MTCDVDYRRDFFFVHESFKRDNEKENDEIKKCKITKKS